MSPVQRFVQCEELSSAIQYHQLARTLMRPIVTTAGKSDTQPRSHWSARNRSSAPRCATLASARVAVTPAQRIPRTVLDNFDATASHHAPAITSAHHCDISELVRRCSSANIPVSVLRRSSFRDRASRRARRQTKGVGGSRRALARHG